MPLADFGEAELNAALSDYGRRDRRFGLVNTADVAPQTAKPEHAEATCHHRPVMLALLLPALFAPMPWPFALLMLLMAGAAAWEWARLNSASAALAVAMGVLVAAACALAWYAGWVRAGASLAWWVAFGVWVLGGALALKVGPSAWHKVPRAARWLLGLAAIWTAWLALSSAKATGINFILSIFCLVWVADIAPISAAGRSVGANLRLPSAGQELGGCVERELGVQLLAWVWILADRHGSWPRQIRPASSRYF